MPTPVEYQNNQDNQNKKQKTRKANNKNNTNSQETILAQKYYINNLESKVNHLENTVTLLQSTLEKRSSTQLSAPRHESVSERSDGCGATQFRQIENRLNSVESQLLNNLYMQN